MNICGKGGYYKDVDCIVAIVFGWSTFKKAGSEKGSVQCYCTGKIWCIVKEFNIAGFTVYVFQMCF